MCVAGIYQPPNTPLAEFTQFITNTLEYTDKCRTVFAGDFNSDSLSCESFSMHNEFTFLINYYFNNGYSKNINKRALLEFF